MKGFAYGIAIFVVACVVFVGLWGMAYAFNWVTAPWSGKLEARQEIQSGPSRIVNYDRFFNLCASVQTAENRIDQLEDNVNLFPTGSFEHSVAVKDVSAAKILRAEAVNTYNADASKNYTAGQFRDSQLPFQLSTAEYKKGGVKTTCA